MWLVLCAATDYAALWAYVELRRAGLEPLMLVGEETLAMPLSFEHRVDDSGVYTRIELASGQVIDSAQVCGVLNRITGIPATHVYRAAPVERDYVLAELNALWVSWLYGLPGPVINRPTPVGLCGAVRASSEWRALGAAAGLATLPLHLAHDDPAALRSPWESLLGDATADDLPRNGHPDTREVLVIGDDVHGDGVPDATRTGCRALARLAGLDIMGAAFRVHGASWQLVDASPRPDLRLAGAAGIVSLRQCLTRSTAAHDPVGRHRL